MVRAAFLYSADSVPRRPSDPVASSIRSVKGMVLVRSSGGALLREDISVTSFGRVLDNSGLFVVA
jgi:hypothetical protein